MPLLREAGRVVSENACVARALLPAFLGTRLKHEVSEKVLRLGPEYHEGHPSREILLFPLSVEITSFCSRDSPHLVLPSPVKQASAAMCVQPNALGRKAIQYIVLYCLTPARFRRYSSLNLCPPSPSPGEDLVQLRSAVHRFGKGGIRLVNMRERMEKRYPPASPSFSALNIGSLATGHWPLDFEGVNVAQTEEASCSRL